MGRMGDGGDTRARNSLAPKQGLDTATMTGRAVPETRRAVRNPREVGPAVLAAHSCGPSLRKLAGLEVGRAAVDRGEGHPQAGRLRSALRQ